MFDIITSLRVGLVSQTLISNWIDRCFGQHLWNSVHSLSRDNPRIPTNPLLGSQQPPLLWGQWIRTKACSKLTRWFKLKLLFSFIVYEGVFLLKVYFGASYTTTFCDPVYTCLFVTERIYSIWALVVRIYSHLRRKWSHTWEKNPQSRKDRKYRRQTTARISCHNFETNGRPFYDRDCGV